MPVCLDARRFLTPCVRYFFAGVCALFFFAGCLLADTDEAANIKRPTTNEVLNNYLKQLGGEYAYNDLISVQMQGSMTTLTAKNIALLSIQKRPNKARITLKEGHQRKLIIGYNGSQAWSRFWQNGETLHYGFLDKNASDSFRRNADILDALACFRTSGYRYELMPDETIDGEPVYVIKVVRPDMPGEEWYYIAKSNYSLLESLVKAPESADGPWRETRTKYSDYRNIEITGGKERRNYETTLRFSYAQKTQNPNGDVVDIQWTQIKPNIGIFDYYFDPVGMKKSAEAKANGAPNVPAATEPDLP